MTSKMYYPHKYKYILTLCTSIIKYTALTNLTQLIEKQSSPNAFGDCIKLTINIFTIGVYSILKAR